LHRIRTPPRTGRLVGLFLAYGTADASKVQWTVGAQERDALVIQCADLLTDLGIHTQLNERVSVIVHGVVTLDALVRPTRGGSNAPSVVVR
jgi:hypothetical protein